MGILVLPLILIKLNEIDIALYYVLIAIQGITILIDFGFGPTYGRFVIYAYSGVNTIEKDSFIYDNSKRDKTVNGDLLYWVFKTGTRFYSIAAMVALILLLIFGLMYFKSIVPVFDTHYLITFVVFSFAVAINILSIYLPSTLRGIGAISMSYKSYAYSKIIYLIFAASGLFLGFGLLAIPTALLLSGVSMFLISKHYLAKQKKILDLKLIHNDKYDFKNTFLKMKHNMVKEGLVSVSRFLTSNFIILLCVPLLGISVAASYGITMQLLNILVSVGIIVFNIQIPKLTYNRVKGNTRNLRDIFSFSVLFFTLIFLSGTIVILLFGNTVLELLNSNATLLPSIIILLLSIGLFTENLYKLAASYIASSNKLPYVKSFLISSIMIASISYFLLKFTSLGVYAFIFTQLIVNGAYNIWKWPLIVLKELKIKFFELYYYGFSFILKAVRIKL